jgi:hypothetical protein
MDLTLLKEQFKSMYGLELDTQLLYAILKVQKERRADRYKFNVHNNWAIAEFRVQQIMADFITAYEADNHGLNISKSIAEGPNAAPMEGTAEAESKSGSNKSNKRLAKKVE